MSLIIADYLEGQRRGSVDKSICCFVENEGLVSAPT